MMASSSFPEPRERSASASKPISLFKEVITSNWLKRGRALTSPPAAPAHFQSETGSSIRPLATLTDGQRQDDRSSAVAAPKRRHPWANEEPGLLAPTEDTETIHPYVSLTYFSQCVESEDLLAQDQEEANEQLQSLHCRLGAAFAALTSTNSSPTMFHRGCCRREYPSAHWLDEDSSLDKHLDDLITLKSSTYPPSELPCLKIPSPIWQSSIATPTHAQAHAQPQSKTSCTLCHCQCIACDWEE
ncbi:hypothetical protein BCV69DRAFT_128983 [Microstroma glucosiphilum]|uniref:Uncharacterized protein n=1 Tax=Pseudomicrostroma glucosiphilum TaxID=1684307 RepID=A0A316U434_9BASI|nr:hypothetical protein BCV69DRAFT_128983 [Pseudomicrostroma glucosiphilum]PWN17685.1 hypothetical protein BCV69DRAFT_128983 [Pseudomicrostroma glucosiphilum]